MAKLLILIPRASNISRIFLCLLVFMITGMEPKEGISEESSASGPLRVSNLNPRYFTDSRGKAVYLTGCHVWDNLQDWGGITPNFNYSSYLDFLKANHHNFVRLWKIGESTQKTHRREILINPMPWQRTGPGAANDGQPKFDLTKFDRVYFDRLRYRVSEAGKRGIYVSIMLFDGIFEWRTHPFNDANNISGINGDMNKDGDGREIFALANSEITKLQRAYVGKIMDTVNDLDNVLYEVGNEIKNSVEWQYNIINYIHSYQITKAKQHMVGMTGVGEGLRNSDLFNSPANWISPTTEPGQNYSYNPPAAMGKKVIISDTDHLVGVLDNPSGEWVWKSFLRGLNPILMDVLQNRAPGGRKERWNEPNRPGLAEARLAMGQTLKYAHRIKLLRMFPQPELASTHYCLANSGYEYLIYSPVIDFRKRERILQSIAIMDRKISVDLIGVSGTFRIEWCDPSTGKLEDGGTVTGGANRYFKVPFNGDALLYLYRG